MATPTPASASKRPGGGVSTPSQLNQSSPAPRSVPSPNAARHHPAGKTPVNHPTTGSSHGSKTVSSTPMVHTLSQSGNSASPGINALGTPGLGGLNAGLGIDGITPSALHNISTPLAFVMSRSDSEMRMSNNAVKRNEDEERRSKMRKVLKNIGRRKGRVSEEAIVRLARRVGMVSDIDDEKLTPEEKDRKVGNRSFSIAGDSVIVTLDLKDHVPQSLEVNGDVAETEEAGRVLLRDLQDSPDQPLTANLDRFSQNLSYLAQMDRLKKETDTDCFSAIRGIYRSLHRLHEKEKEILTSQTAARADMNATCKRSGRPIMHARRRLGLSLDYWQQNRYSGNRWPSIESNIDLEDSSTHWKLGDLWTLHIGAQKSSADNMTFAPLRVSDQWVPERLELSAETSSEDIPWSEPSDDHGTLPKPCFSATLDPPLVLPYPIADAILKSFNTQIAPNMESIPSYLSLLISTYTDLKTNLLSTSTRPGVIMSQQVATTMRNGESTQVQHQYTVDYTKPDFGHVIRSMSFSHPKQLVQLLPTLRQWAGFAMLVSQSFEAGVIFSGDKQSNDKSSRPKARPSPLDAIMQDAPDTDGPTGLAIDLSLSTTPQPTLSLSFARIAPESPAVSLDVQVLSNAAISVSIGGGFEFSDEEAKSKAEAKMAKGLDVCWDLGVWIEWIRGEDFS